MTVEGLAIEDIAAIFAERMGDGWYVRIEEEVLLCLRHLESHTVLIVAPHDSWRVETSPVSTWQFGASHYGSLIRRVANIGDMAAILAGCHRDWWVVELASARAEMQRKLKEQQSHIGHLKDLIAALQGVTRQLDTENEELRDLVATLQAQLPPAIQRATNARLAHINGPDLRVPTPDDPDGIVCATHGPQRRAHPYWHDQRIFCAICAHMREREYHQDQPEK